VPKVHFLNEYLTVDAPEGSLVLDLAKDNGVQIFRGLWPSWNCGGLGICGRCKVWLPADAKVSPPTLPEQIRRTIGLDSGDQRLACNVKVEGDVEVRVKPIAPSYADLQGTVATMEEASYKEAAAEKLVVAKADEKKKAEAAKKKKEAAAKKKAEAAAKKKAEEEEAAKKAEEEAAAEKAEEEAAAKAEEPEAKKKVEARSPTSEQKAALDKEEDGWDIDEESLKPKA